jgi:predicted nucleic-acid-binding protein
VIAVDTNVLVRVLVDDPEETSQVERARRLAKEAGELFVPQVVQVETVWVLTGAYGLDREQVTAVLDHLASNQAFRLQAESCFEAALQLYREGPADFADYLVLSECQNRRCELMTFDRDLGREEGARIP